MNIEHLTAIRNVILSDIAETELRLLGLKAELIDINKRLPQPSDQKWYKTTTRQPIFAGSDK